jgi:transcription initiation factor TFIID subunit 7
VLLLQRSVIGGYILMVDPRRAVVRIRKNLYAAKLVDLPTIVESSKTLDRKNLYKTGDICQMLLVGEQISHEETILAYPSRPSDYIYPHGITPPLRWVRKRRFRRRISNRVTLPPLSHPSHIAFNPFPSSRIHCLC